MLNGLNYPGNCKSLDVSKELHGIDVKQLFFNFKGVDFSKIQHSVDIWAENRQTNLDRANKNIRWYNSGEEKMTLDLKYPKYRDYLISFTMTKYAESDASKECVDYPTEEFDTYNDCDREFILQVLGKFL